MEWFYCCNDTVSVGLVQQFTFACRSRRCWLIWNCNEGKDYKCKISGICNI